MLLESERFRGHLSHRAALVSASPIRLFCCTHVGDLYRCRCGPIWMNFEPHGYVNMATLIIRAKLIIVAK
jgi:hypothetical protein